jgi:hypothetical protein
MTRKDRSPRLVQTDLATMLSIMQQLCPDDKAIVACVADMMNKGEILKAPFNTSVYATA